MDIQRGSKGVGCPYRVYTAGGFAVRTAATGDSSYGILIVFGVFRQGFEGGSSMFKKGV